MSHTESHGTGSLRATDEASKTVATAPRISLEDIHERVAKISYSRGTYIAPISVNDSNAVVDALACLTVCLIVLDNGFIVVGKSAPASPANFDVALGQKHAYDDAIRQIWPLLGFDLRERLHRLQKASPVT